MGAKTEIEWAESTWTPIRGTKGTWHCTKVSPGCQFCYSERLNTRRGGPPYRVGADTLRLDLETLAQPYSWKKARRVFVCSMTDLFHEDVPFGVVMQCLRVMAETPRHTYLVLTKRAGRMRDFFMRWGDLSGEDFIPKLARGSAETRAAHLSGRGQLFADMLEAMGPPPPGRAHPTFDWLEGMIRWPRTFDHIWLGVSAEDQKYADERIPLLLETPAAVRFVSLEPLLGPITVEDSIYRVCQECRRRFMPKDLTDGAWGHPCAAKRGITRCESFCHPRLDWVIVGGESGGPRERALVSNHTGGHGSSYRSTWEPKHDALAWVRCIRDQCQAAGVPFFCKQWGGPTPKSGGRLLDGRMWDGYPAAMEQ